MKRTKNSIAAIGFLVLCTGLISASFASYKMAKTSPPRSGGAAANGLGDRTGSPNSSSTCSACHSGGTPTTTFTIQVFDALNNPVSSYTPGDTYTLQYNVSNANSNGFGMQSVVLNSSNTNAGTLVSVLTSNSQITSSAGIDYFEHLGTQTTGSFAVQWTAPAAGSGTVSIYGVGLGVNANGNTTGDVASLPTSISLTEDIPTSINFLGNPYCSDASNPSPVITGEQGGTFSAPGGLSINASSGQINIAGSTPGTYTVTYTSATQSATFDVTINQTYSTSDAVSICSNETYQFGSQTLTAANAGLNTEVFQTSNGCDSTVQLTLSVLPNSTTQMSATICANETYLFNGQTLDASNAGLNTYATTGTNGCDSLVELTLTVLPLDTVQISETICQGETFDFNGQILDESNAGLNVANLSNVNGCDSIVELTLNVTTIDPTLTIGVGQLTSNQNNASYQWYNCDDDVMVTGETNQQFNTMIQASYAAIITLDGCVDTSDCEIPIFMGIAENATALIQVYPSPAKERLLVKNLAELTDIEFMQIVNLSGQQAWTSVHPKEEISVANLPSGTYFLKVLHAKGEDIVKFVKE